MAEAVDDDERSQQDNLGLSQSVGWSETFEAFEDKVTMRQFFRKTFFKAIQNVNITGFFRREKLKTKHMLQT